MSDALIVGVVLAGGASRRMGGRAKALLGLSEDETGETLLERACRRLGRQVPKVIVNANDDAPGFAPTETVVVRDAFPDRRGPLAGVLAAMEWATANEPRAKRIASVPVDSPFFPDDLIAKLESHSAEHEIALAQVGGREQPVFGLWPIALATSLRWFLEDGSTLKILDFVKTHLSVSVPFDDEAAFDNVNTPEDLLRARAKAAG